MGTSIRKLEDTYFRWLRRTDTQLRSMFDTYDAAARLHLPVGWLGRPPGWVPPREHARDSGADTLAAAEGVR